MVFDEAMVERLAASRWERERHHKPWGDRAWVAVPGEERRFPLAHARTDLRAALGAVAASPDEGPKDDAKCRCGHTAHWHAAVVYDGPGEPETVPQGAGGCEERSEDGSPCGCEWFRAVAGPADEGLRAAVQQDDAPGIVTMTRSDAEGLLAAAKLLRSAVACRETLSTEEGHRIDAALRRADEILFPDAAAGCLPEDEKRFRRYRTTRDWKPDLDNESMEDAINAALADGTLVVDSAVGDKDPT